MRFLLAASLLLTACGPDDNATGCKDSLHAGDLVITEVFADFQAPAGGTGTDTGKEWFEVYNNLDRPVALKGLTVTHSRPDGSKAASHTLTDVTLAPGQYFTLGNATPNLIPAYIDYGYSADLGDFYNSDGGKLALSCGDRAIDSAVYDGIKSGHARELSAASAPDYTFNDDLANWCQGDATEFEDGNFGTPGGENDCQPLVVGACSDGGNMRSTVPPGVGDLVITELMPKPKTLSATVAQWFEIKAMKDVDLNGVGLDRANDNNINPEILTSTDCIHMTAGSYGLFARSDDSGMNGGLTVISKFGFSLNPTANPDVRLVYGADVIDAITWMTSTTGASLQLDPAATDAASNDDPTNFCNGMTSYEANGNLGTPGTANATCPAVVGPGQCLDNGNPRDIVAPAAGQLVINEFLANPQSTGTDGAQEWFEIMNTGGTAFDLNGLGVKGGSGTVQTIISSNCKSVPAGMWALFAHSTDPATNGQLPAVDATFSFALANSNGAITVYAADGTTVLDTVTWTTPQQADGIASQLKPGNANVTDNDTQTNFCPGTATQMYDTVTNLPNFGTPKAPNVCL